MEMTTSKTYQEEQNGPLVASVRKRIQAVRDKLGYSWADMGEAFEFSNTFVHGISREDDPQRIRTKHIAQLIQNLESLEVKAGILHVGDRSPPSGSTAISVAQLSLEDLVHAIAAKGFTVTIAPAAKV
jgi:hypothetical protein